MGDFMIRDARADDFGHVLPLLRQLWPTKEFDPARTHAAFLAGLARPDHVYVVRAAGRVIVGFASMTYRTSLWLDGEVAALAELVVEETARGRGHGSALVEELTHRAQARGCRRLELDSAFHRTETHAFYEARGFEQRGVVFSKVLSVET